MRWLGVLLGLVLLAPAVTTSASPVLPDISAPAAIVVDGWTGNVLYARNPDVPRYPASTVKIMTFLLVLRHHMPLNRIVSVSAYAASYSGSTAGLYSGERISLRDLLYAMMLPSGNDAAIEISQLLAPTPAAFARLMNAEARRLRLWHTHFLTPNGFDTWGQDTTARDLAALARVAMQKQVFARVVDTREWRAVSADGRFTHTWTNTDQLLWRNPAVDGVKTGTTPLAGANLVASARQAGKWIISVNMGSTEAARFDDGMALLNYGFLVDASPPSTR